MEATMQSIKTYDGSPLPESRLSTLRRHIGAGLKWWAEHQAWPATDEIRVDRHRSTCG